MAKKVYGITDEVYNSVLADNGQYETSDTGIAINGSDNRLQALNKYYRIGNARNYSSYLQFRDWTITEIAKLQQMRFDIGKGDIIGRDIITRYSQIIPNEIIRDIVYLSSFDGIVLSFVDSNGNMRTVKAWITGSGKRTRYGKPSNGEIVTRVKVHYQSKGKRNRRTMGF